MAKEQVTPRLIISFTLAISGWIADNSKSRRMPLLFGLILQIVGSCLFARHPTIVILIVARALQGASAAIVYSVGLALVVDTFGVDAVGEKAGYALSSATIGVICGPVLGGAVYEHAGYAAVVGMMIGLVAVDILLRLLMVEKKKAIKWQQSSVSPRSPSKSDICSDHDAHRRDNGTSGSIDRTLRSDEEAGYTHEETTIPEAGDSEPNDELRSLLPKIRHREKPWTMPPIWHLMRSPRILADVYAVFITYVLLAGFDSDLASFVKETFKWGSTGAGLIYLTIALPSLLAPIAGSLADRVGARWICTLGFATNFVCVTLLRLVTHNTIQQQILLFCLMTLIGNSTPCRYTSRVSAYPIRFTSPGCALTLSVAPITSDLIAAVEAIALDDPTIFGKNGAYAQAFALFNCALAGGTVVGPLWTSLMTSRLGWGNMNLCLAAFALTGTVAVVS